MMVRGGSAILAGGLLLALGLPSSTVAQQAPPPATSISAADKAKLEAMRKAADDLDEGADPAKYRAAWDEVLVFARTLYPAGHPELAWLESELVTADYLQGDIRGALARADRIAASLEAGGADYRERRVEVANGQVVILMTLGEHGRARELAPRVLAWRIAASGGKPSSHVAAAYSNYANAEFEFGNYDKAIELVRKAIAEDKRLDPIPPNVAPHFANLPVYLFNTGRLEEATEEAHSTQAMLERILPKNHPFLASNLNTLARILMELGRHAEAETVARRAADIAVARFGQSQQAVFYLTTLSQALAGRGKNEEAVAIAKTAADILVKDLGAEADRTLAARETHAMALAAGGDRAGAMAMLKEVAAIRERRLPAFHRERIGGGDRMATLALKLGDLTAAAAAQREAQRLRHATFPAEDVAALVGEARLAAIEARGGATSEGLARALAAAKQLDEQLRRADVAGSRRSGRDRAIRSGYGWAFDAALGAGDRDAAFMLAHRMLESSAGRAVREAARRALDDPRTVVLLRERQDAAIELEALLDRQLRLAGRGADAAAIQAVGAERAAAAAWLAARTAELAARAPQLVAGEEAMPLPLADVQRALAPNEAMLVVAVGEARTGVFAITRDSVTMAASDVGAERVDGWVRRIRAGIEGGPGATFDFAASAELHDLVLPKAIRETLRGKPRVLISANGALAALPFATLAPRQAKPTLRSARWLIRDHALVTLPSIASIAAPRARAGAGQLASFFAVGAPDLAGTAALDGAFRSAGLARQVRELPSLPATEAELRALGAGLAAREQTVLTGTRATEAALRSADLTRANIIAFATHGLTAGDLDGLEEPALVVTPEGSDDGLLTASEIMRLRIGADWILLSACNTAGGGTSDSGGLAGLARAFLYAGGRNLLASHWAVRDDAAALLSVGAMRGYARGADPAEALRRTMLRMIDARPLPGSEQPVNWAPFVFIGR
jgi:CHAT domain-containing protein/tetratricopeptide (TPR) repeat protein